MFTITTERLKIAKAAGLMSFATLISRILGYAKDMILARYFGATGIADTFFVAFRIPNLLRELFAEGSMSSAFIPVLTEYKTKNNDKEVKRIVIITFSFILITVGIFCALGIVFSDFIVKVIAPGFVYMPDKFNLTVLLTKIMFPFLLFISLAALLMGALNTKKIFFIPSLAPAMLNITIIVIVILFAYRLNPPILSVAIGVTLGSFLQFLFQVPSFYKNGYSFGLNLDFSHPALKKMLILVLPATMGMAVAQINIFVSTILASYLEEGSITYLYYSMRLIQFPIGMFGVAMGMAVLPSLSEHAAKGDLKGLSDDFTFSLRLLFFVTIPAMVGLIALREPIVNLLFQRGKFDYVATVGTANALLYYSLGIWSIVGVRTITASFYSMQDTKTPVKIAVVALISNVVLSVILMRLMKYAGLALSNSLASMINFFLLFYFLKRRLSDIMVKKILILALKILFISIIMGLIGWQIVHGDLWQYSGKVTIKVVYLSLTIFLCLFIYFLLSYFFRIEEYIYILEFIKNKIMRTD